MANFVIRTPTDGESIKVGDTTVDYVLVVAGGGKGPRTGITVTVKDSGGNVVGAATTAAAAPPRWLAAYRIPAAVVAANIASGQSLSLIVAQAGAPNLSKTQTFKLIPAT